MCTNRLLTAPRFPALHTTSDRKARAVYSFLERRTVLNGLALRRVIRII